MDPTFMQVILILCMIINCLWLLVYVRGGYRKLEEYARNNWTFPGQVKRQAIAPKKLESGLSKVESKNTTTQAPTSVLKEAPPYATELNRIGKLPVSGYVFDLIFGIETALNLSSDVMMQVASMWSWKTPATKVTLQVFFGWNCFSTGVCYLASLFLADFNSRIVEFEAKKNDIDEPTFRARVKTTLIVVHTLVLLVKISVLCCIFMFLYNLDTLAEEPDGPGGGPQTQPNATATEEASTAGGNTTMTDLTE